MTRSSSPSGLLPGRPVVLALCGSLRAASINAALLRALARLAPADVEVAIFPSLGELPLFNPDREADLPPPVQALHVAVARADALVIASPEYAHGISGTIKNALDWLVSFEPFIHKPTVVLNASPRAHHADAALRETLRTMSAGLVGDASFPVPLLGAHLDEDAMVASAAVSAVAAQAFAALRAELVRQRAADVPVFPLR
jgi:NAD(P)H-dependent FMN reductase